MRLSTMVVASIVSALVLIGSVAAWGGDKTAISRKATRAKVDMATVAKDLRSYASELRSIERQMTSVAKNQEPGFLDNSERAPFETKRNQLNATAAAARDLVSRIEVLAKKAERGTMTRADLESLGVAVEPVAQLVDRATADSSDRLSSTGLNSLIREVESQQETLRNNHQMASASFQNFDQKANQLYNLLSQVVKTMNEMRMAPVRNML